MTTIGINLLVYMQELNNGTAQSALLPTIAGHGVTLAEVRREYIKDDAEFDRIREAAEANGLDLFYSVPESLTIGGAANPGFEGFLDEAVRMGVRNVKFNQGDVKDVEAAVIAADIAVKSGDVYLGFADRFTGTVIITGELADVTSALTEIVNYFRDELGYVVCRITKR